MTISTPITNARQYYVNGLRLEYVSGSTIVVTVGRCSDISNTNDISVGLPLNVAATQTGVEPVAAGSGPVSILSTRNGAAGLDTGTIAASTFYAVYAIGDSYGLNPGSALISANLAAPVLPSGYDMYFRIGFVKTNGSGSILAFAQAGSGLDRWMYYDTPIATNITSGSATSYEAIDLTNSLPVNMQTQMSFYCSYVPTGAPGILIIAAGQSASGPGYAVSSGSVSGVIKYDNLICPTGNPDNLVPITQAAEYKVSAANTVIISVNGYLDPLGQNPID